jgi:hypothetical protein
MITQEVSILLPKDWVKYGRDLGVASYRKNAAEFFLQPQNIPPKFFT